MRDSRDVLRFEEVSDVSVVASATAITSMSWAHRHGEMSARPEGAVCGARYLLRFPMDLVAREYERLRGRNRVFELEVYVQRRKD